MVVALHNMAQNREYPLVLLISLFISLKTRLSMGCFLTKTEERRRKWRLVKFLVQPKVLGPHFAGMLRSGARRAEAGEGADDIWWPVYLLMEVQLVNLRKLHRNPRVFLMFFSIRTFGNLIKNIEYAAAVVVLSLQNCWLEGKIDEGWIVFSPVDSINQHVVNGFQWSSLKIFGRKMESACHAKSLGWLFSCSHRRKFSSMRLHQLSVASTIQVIHYFLNGHAYTSGPCNYWSAMFGHCIFYIK